MQQLFQLLIFNFRFSLILILSFLIITGGCKKPEDLGLNVLPSSDPLGTPFSDTATILSVTTREDSLKSDELSRMVLGSYNEPEFGLSDASVFTQILLGNTPSLRSN